MAPRPNFSVLPWCNPSRAKPGVRSIRPHRLRARQVKPDQPGFEPKQQREGRSPAPMRRAVSESGLVRLYQARTRVIFETSPSRAQGRRGWRIAQRIQNPEGLRGAPREVWAPGGAATEPHRGDGILLLGSMFLALGGCIAGPIVGPIAAAIGEP